MANRLGGGWGLFRYPQCYAQTWDQKPTGPTHLLPLSVWVRGKGRWPRSRVEEVQDWGLCLPLRAPTLSPTSVSTASSPGPCWRHMSVAACREESHHPDDREPASTARSSSLWPAGFRPRVTFTLSACQQGSSGASIRLWLLEPLPAAILANEAARMPVLRATSLGISQQIGASRRRERMFLFADTQQPAGPSSATIFWCGWPLLMLPKPSCQGGDAWRMWRWWSGHLESRWHQGPPSRVKEMVYTQAL